MSIESFGFILVVALFGMLVVFGLLALLSVFMSAIRGMDRFIPAGSVDGEPPATRNERRAARRRITSTPPAALGRASEAPAGTAAQNWVVAAAVAYLVLEEADARPEASPWTGGRAFRGDPWLANHFGDQR